MTGTMLAGPVLAGAVSSMPAAAAPSTGTPGQKVCSISDERLDALSGLTATSKGYAVINNTGGNGLAIYRLDTKSCQVTDVIEDSRPPFDPEDLASTPDGTLWVADTGDKDQERDTIALWKFKPGDQQATLYRMSYPDTGDRKDAKALLMQPDGTPIVVTYERGTGHLYEPTGSLDPDQPTPMKAVGQLRLTATDTPGGAVGPLGQLVFTGGAVSPDGRKAVLRTYTDAYEWTVNGANIAKSITSGKPRRTPLPNEPAGEAITYTSDGSRYLTVSDTENSSASPRILRYAPAAAPAPSHRATRQAGDSGGSFLSNLSLSDITDAVIAVGVIGLALVALGVFGIRRSRRGPPPSDGPGGSRRGPDPDLPEDAETVVLPRVSERGRPSANRMDGDEPRPPRRRRYAEDPAGSSNAETAVIDLTSDREPPPPRARREPPSVPGGRYGEPSSGSRYGEPPSRGRREPPPPSPRDRYQEPPPRSRSHREPPPGRRDDIDWLDDSPDSYRPPPRREPPDSDTSGRINRRLR